MIDNVQVIVGGGVTDGEIVDGIRMYFMTVVVKEIGGTVGEMETRFHKAHSFSLFNVLWIVYQEPCTVFVTYNMVK